MVVPNSGLCGLIVRTAIDENKLLSKFLPTGVILVSTTPADCSITGDAIRSRARGAVRPSVLMSTLGMSL